MANRIQKSVPMMMILPGLALAIAIIGYPIFDLGWTSMHDVSRFGKLTGFNGGENFAEVFVDPLFWESLWRTGIWTVAVVGGTLAISMPVAMILNDDFHGRGVARVIIMLPWAISLTMTAVVWRWALNGRAGLLNATLMNAGIIDQPIEWLATASTAFVVEILVGILVSIPFTTTILLGGLSSMPQDAYEAAVVDGASGWHQFRYITLPLMKPFINIAIVLNVIYVFNSLPIIWVMTEGGPANGTDILVTYLYKLAFRFGQLGKAAAISLVMFFVLLAFTMLYVALVSRNDRDDAAPEEEVKE
ncbi:carbohydrate ABC transporter permease [Tabrizicola oligotrophica]|uniref:Sugar ABC transporter permease n=1 Tax=Tabrizicola oligotrophica TaxID=2710650 RepID=A0A6M0QT49_9RHOB|nr:sugar ABC transporter permease [Tabrizicola oligotrophica]NEY90626.1 sugar ABC transporter permease [Tabrizicola oligotrophica]